MISSILNADNIYRPTGIKIFSWLLFSFSKRNLASRIIEKNLKTLNLLERFPRSNRNYLPSNNKCKALVVFGSNLSSTVGYPPYTSIVRHMVKFPDLATVGRFYELESILVGILISDGWMSISKSGNTRFFFKQSLDKIEYFLDVYNKFAHYCSNYPQIRVENLNNKKFYGIYFATRSLPCFTYYYDLFYQKKVKVVPSDLYNLLTYEALAHWIIGSGYIPGEGQGLIICTKSFSIKEVILLINILIHKFGLECTLITLNPNQYQIHIKQSSMPLLWAKVPEVFHKKYRLKVCMME